MAAGTTRRRASMGGTAAIGRALAPVALLLAMPAAGQAGPLELANASPRPIEVRFEVSPADQPGRLDAVWSEPRSARVEPSGDGAHLQIRIPASVMEQHLRSTGTAVIPGSFSDFVWLLDRRTGEVLASRLEGRIHERLAVGPFATRVAVGIAVDMSTDRRGGFRTQRAPFGIETHAFCAPEGETAEGCVAVESRRFDPRDGYVNAVGVIRAATPVAEVRAFSPLGEVRFSERAAPAVIDAAWPTPRRDAVFSAGDRPDEGRIERGGWHGGEARRPGSEAGSPRG